jgi:hypothetical protein
MGRIEKTLHMFWQAKNCRAAVLALITADAIFFAFSTMVFTPLSRDTSRLLKNSLPVSF